MAATSMAMPTSLSSCARGRANGLAHASRLEERTSDGTNHCRRPRVARRVGIEYWVVKEREERECRRLKARPSSRWVGKKVGLSREVSCSGWVAPSKFEALGSRNWSHDAMSRRLSMQEL